MAGDGLSPADKPTPGILVARVDAFGNAAQVASAPKNDLLAGIEIQLQQDSRREEGQKNLASLADWVLKKVFSVRQDETQERLRALADDVAANQSAGDDALLAKRSEEVKHAVTEDQQAGEAFGLHARTFTANLIGDVAAFLPLARGAAREESAAARVASEAVETAAPRTITLANTVLTGTVDLIKEAKAAPVATARRVITSPAGIAAVVTGINNANSNDGTGGVLSFTMGLAGGVATQKSASLIGRQKTWNILTKDIVVDELCGGVATQKSASLIGRQKTWNILTKGFVLGEAQIGLGGLSDIQTYEDSAVSIRTIGSPHLDGVSDVRTNEDTKENFDFGTGIERTAERAVDPLALLPFALRLDRFTGGLSKNPLAANAIGGAASGLVYGLSNGIDSQWTANGFHVFSWDYGKIASDTVRTAMAQAIGGAAGRGLDRVQGAKGSILAPHSEDSTVGAPTPPAAPAENPIQLKFEDARTPFHTKMLLGTDENGQFVMTDGSQPAIPAIKDPSVGQRLILQTPQEAGFHPVDHVTVSVAGKNQDLGLFTKPNEAGVFAAIPDPEVAGITRMSPLDNPVTREARVVPPVPAGTTAGASTGARQLLDMANGLPQNQGVERALYDYVRDHSALIDPKELAPEKVHGRTAEGPVELVVSGAPPTPYDHEDTVGRTVPNLNGYRTVVVYDSNNKPLNYCVDDKGRLYGYAPRKEGGYTLTPSPDRRLVDPASVLADPSYLIRTDAGKPVEPITALRDALNAAIDASDGDPAAQRAAVATFHQYFHALGGHIKPEELYDPFLSGTDAHVLDRNSKALGLIRDAYDRDHLIQTAYNSVLYHQVELYRTATQPEAAPAQPGVLVDRLAHNPEVEFLQYALNSTRPGENLDPHFIENPDGDPYFVRSAAPSPKPPPPPLVNRAIELVTAAQNVRTIAMGADTSGNARAHLQMYFKSATPEVRDLLRTYAETAIKEVTPAGSLREDPTTVVEQAYRAGPVAQAEQRINDILNPNIKAQSLDPSTNGRIERSKLIADLAALGREDPGALDDLSHFTPKTGPDNDHLVENPDAKPFVEALVNSARRLQRGEDLLTAVARATDDTTRADATAALNTFIRTQGTTTGGKDLREPLLAFARRNFDPAPTQAVEGAYEPLVVRASDLVGTVARNESTIQDYLYLVNFWREHGADAFTAAVPNEQGALGRPGRHIVEHIEQMKPGMPEPQVPEHLKPYYDQAKGALDKAVAAWAASSHPTAQLPAVRDFMIDVTRIERTKMASSAGGYATVRLDLYDYALQEASRGLPEGAQIPKDAPIVKIVQAAYENAGYHVENPSPVNPETWSAFETALYSQALPAALKVDTQSLPPDQRAAALTAASAPLYRLLSEDPILTAKAFELQNALPPGPLREVLEHVSAEVEADVTAHVGEATNLVRQAAQVNATFSDYQRLIEFWQQHGRAPIMSAQVMRAGGETVIPPEERALFDRIAGRTEGPFDPRLAEARPQAPGAGQVATAAAAEAIAVRIERFDAVRARLDAAVTAVDRARTADPNVDVTSVPAVRQLMTDVLAMRADSSMKRALYDYTLYQASKPGAPQDAPILKIMQAATENAGFAPQNLPPEHAPAWATFQRKLFDEALPRVLSLPPGAGEADINKATAPVYDLLSENTYLAGRVRELQTTLPPGPAREVLERVSARVEANVTAHESEAAQLIRLAARPDATFTDYQDLDHFWREHGRAPFLSTLDSQRQGGFTPAEQALIDRIAARKPGAFEPQLGAPGVVPPADAAAVAKVTAARVQQFDSARVRLDAAAREVEGARAVDPNVDVTAIPAVRLLMTDILATRGDDQIKYALYDYALHETSKPGAAGDAPILSTIQTAYENAGYKMRTIRPDRLAASGTLEDTLDKEVLPAVLRLDLGALAGQPRQDALNRATDPLYRLLKTDPYLAMKAHELEATLPAGPVRTTLDHVYNRLQEDIDTSLHAFEQRHADIVAARTARDAAQTAIQHATQQETDAREAAGRAETAMRQAEAARDGARNAGQEAKQRLLELDTERGDRILEERHRLDRVGQLEALRTEAETRLVALRAEKAQKDADKGNLENQIAAIADPSRPAAMLEIAALRRQIDDLGINETENGISSRAAQIHRINTWLGDLEAQRLDIERRRQAGEAERPQVAARERDQYRLMNQQAQRANDQRIEQQNQLATAAAAHATQLANLLIPGQQQREIDRLSSDQGDPSLQLGLRISLMNQLLFDRYLRAQDDTVSGAARVFQNPVVARVVANPVETAINSATIRQFLSVDQAVAPAGRDPVLLATALARIPALPAPNPLAPVATGTPDIVLPNSVVSDLVRQYPELARAALLSPEVTDPAANRVDPDGRLVNYLRVHGVPPESGANIPREAAPTGPLDQFGNRAQALNQLLEEFYDRTSGEIRPPGRAPALASPQTDPMYQNIDPRFVAPVKGIGIDALIRMGADDPAFIQSITNPRIPGEQADRLRFAAATLSKYATDIGQVRELLNLARSQASSQGTADPADKIAFLHTAVDQLVTAATPEMVNENWNALSRAGVQPAELKVRAEAAANAQVDYDKAQLKQVLEAINSWSAQGGPRPPRRGQGGGGSWRQGP